MIAEALDSGVLTVSAVAGLLVVVAGGAAWAATTRSDIRSIAKDVASLAKSFRDLTRGQDDHRVEDDARFADQGRRLDRLEIVVDLTPIHGIDIRDRPPTGPQPRLRGDTPRPRRHEDTGPGESR